LGTGLPDAIYPSQIGTGPLGFPAAGPFLKIHLSILCYTLVQS